MDGYGYAPTTQKYVQESPYSADTRVSGEIAERLTVLRTENTRLRELAADQLLDLKRLRSSRITSAAVQSLKERRSNGN